MATLPAPGLVESKGSLATMSEKVQSRILALTETSRPEVTPLTKNAVDGCFYSVIVNTLDKPVNFRLYYGFRTRFIYFVQQYLFV